ncbi:hypothetical protein Pmgp_02269 [Pelotomaculum propionicicum]|uniref:Uncharacterized protein n=1 Tax=Pelotomaculum propionicicum TaxID=258475 RepID=A0A4Y7RPB5_9FIRM|nr:hypothetical protein Pmgp_02269 [Pelotomaculum propionicicum]
MNLVGSISIEQDALAPSLLEILGTYLVNKGIPKIEMCSHSYDE